jgi:coenzyme F420-reducing hydrogenase alpha subunit
VSGSVQRTRTIRVDALARVEGEGALSVHVKDGKVTELSFRIFEPPRYFEALLRGRPYSDVPDIASRICGICPIAYNLGASLALEDAFGAVVDGPLRALRRLSYCGEWIQSHVLHTHMLHAPDFLGYQDAFEMAKHHPGVVEAALGIKKLGNAVMEAVGGRSVHPVNLRVGGFYKVPARAAIRALAAPLKHALDGAIETTRFFSTFDFPDYEDDYVFVALHDPAEYAIDRGRIVSNHGLSIETSDFEEHFGEEHVAHSTALQGFMKPVDRPYLLGPLARYALNYEQLSPLAKQLAAEAGLGTVVRNPFKSILIRAIETAYALEEALRIVQAYEEPDLPSVPLNVRAGRGFGVTEAPRGLCYHRYDVDAEGRIESANIVPPTSQNQKQIERDLWGVVSANLSLADDDLKWRCEQTIRNYDPCISCAAHALRFTIVREPNDTLEVPQCP